jgi:FKBP-type peptidyl-prolyl cis-trans isomerase FklB
MRTRNKIWFLIAVLIAMSFQSCTNQTEDTSKIELKNRMDTVSYIIGLDYGIGINEQKIDVNSLAVYKGLLDGLNDTSLLTDSLKLKIIDEFNEVLKGRMEEEGKIFLDSNKADGIRFMAENKKTEGVVVLPSGLQYKVMKEGKGEQPNSTDSVLVHYRAMFVDRTVFDMSYDRGPAGIRLNSVIPGLSEGVQLMKPGAIYELFIPPELAYGDKTFANVIPGGSTLIYSIELIEIVNE